MALTKNLILRSPRSGRLEGRTAPIPSWTAGVSPAPMRPGRPRSDTKACRYVDATDRRAGGIGNLFHRLGSAGAIAPAIFRP